MDKFYPGPGKNTCRKNSKSFRKIRWWTNAGGKTISMEAPDTTLPDIKHLIRAMKGYAGFLPLPTKARPGNQLLFNPFVVNDSFIDLNGTNQLILPKHFDGLLMLKHVSPANLIE